MLFLFCAYHLHHSTFSFRTKQKKTAQSSRLRFINIGPIFVSGPVYSVANERVKKKRVRTFSIFYFLRLPEKATCPWTSTAIYGVVKLLQVNCRFFFFFFWGYILMTLLTCQTRWEEWASSLLQHCQTLGYVLAPICPRRHNFQQDLNWMLFPECSDCERDVADPRSLDLPRADVNNTR